MTHQTGANPGFRSTKQLGVFLLCPEWDAHRRVAFLRYLFVYTGGERHCENKLFWLRIISNVPGQGSNSDRRSEGERNQATASQLRLLILNYFYRQRFVFRDEVTTRAFGDRFSWRMEMSESSLCCPPEEDTRLRLFVDLVSDSLFCP